MIEVNLNDKVEFTLTDFGRHVWLEYHAKLYLQLRIPRLSDKRDIFQPITMQFWELMQVFGPEIRFGMESVPFVGNSLRFLDESDRPHVEIELHESATYLV